MGYDDSRFRRRFRAGTFINPAVLAAFILCSFASWADDCASGSATSLSLEPSAVLERGLVSEGDCARLKAAIERALRGEAITIAGIGGSITASGLATKPEFRYLNRFWSWWNSRFKQTSRLVNAGVGATGSLYGVFRVERDVLRENPDLVIVEFAVNDGASNPDTGPAMEALVRKLLVAPKKPAVIMVFTMREDGTNAQDIHAAVGRHYGLPMLSYRDALYPAVEANVVQWQELAGDHVHPGDKGMEYIAMLLTNFTERVAQAPCGGKIAAGMPARLHPESEALENGVLIPAARLPILENNGWQATNFWQFSGVLAADKPGTAFTCMLQGTRLYLAHKKLAGAMGRVEVRVDDRAPVVLDGFFEATGAWKGGHIVFPLIAEGLAPGEHTLAVRLLPERHMESSGFEFVITSLLCGGIEPED